MVRAGGNCKHDLSRDGAAPQRQVEQAAGARQRHGARRCAGHRSPSTATTGGAGSRNREQRPLVSGALDQHNAQCRRDVARHIAEPRQFATSTGASSAEGADQTGRSCAQA